MTIREYGSRTAAANFLRGKGIAAADFNTFIKTKGDKFLVNDALIGQPVKTAVSEAIAEAPKVKLPLETNVKAVEAPKKVAAKPAKANAKTGKKVADKKPAAKKPAAKKDPTKPLPVSQFCLSMFKAGNDNATVWAALQNEYGLDDDKAHYPSWYRSHFRRKGVLPAPSAKGAR